MISLPCFTVKSSPVSFDEDVLRFLNGHRSSAATAFVRFVMHLGSPKMIATGTVFGLVLVIAGRWYRPALAVFLAAPFAALAANLLKDVFERPRPPAELALLTVGGFSMPSTEAARTSAAAMALLFGARWSSRLIRRCVAAGLAVALLAVGASMVYLGAHWVTDVLAGWALGLCVGAGFGWVCRSARRGVPLPRTGEG